MDLEKTNAATSELNNNGIQTWVSNEDYLAAVKLGAETSKVAEMAKQKISELEAVKTDLARALDRKQNELFDFKQTAAEALLAYEQSTGYSMETLFDDMGLERPSREVDVEITMKVTVRVTVPGNVSEGDIEQALRTTESDDSVVFEFASDLGSEGISVEDVMIIGTSVDEIDR